MKENKSIKAENFNPKYRYKMLKKVILRIADLEFRLRLEKQHLESISWGFEADLINSIKREVKK